MLLLLPAVGGHALGGAVRAQKNIADIAMNNQEQTTAKCWLLPILPSVRIATQEHLTNEALDEYCVARLR